SGAAPGRLPVDRSARRKRNKPFRHGRGVADPGAKRVFGREWFLPAIADAPGRAPGRGTRSGNFPTPAPATIDVGPVRIAWPRPAAREKAKDRRAKSAGRRWS